MQWAQERERERVVFAGKQMKKLHCWLISRWMRIVDLGIAQSRAKPIPKYVVSLFPFGDLCDFPRNSINYI